MVDINFGLNIATHIFILLTFLVAFFFLFISNVEKKIINDQINDKINEQIPQLLQQLDQDDTDHIIVWSAVETFADDMDSKSQGDDPTIESNNNNLLKIAVG